MSSNIFNYHKIIELPLVSQVYKLKLDKTLKLGVNDPFSFKFKQLTKPDNEESLLKPLQNWDRNRNMAKPK